jgi:hypothetical protein
MSGEALQIRQGSLYAALYRLEQLRSRRSTGGTQGRGVAVFGELEETEVAGLSVSVITVKQDSRVARVRRTRSPDRHRRPTLGCDFQNPDRPLWAINAQASCTAAEVYPAIWRGSIFYSAFAIPLHGQVGSQIARAIRSGANEAPRLPSTRALAQLLSVLGLRVRTTSQDELSPKCS